MATVQRPPKAAIPCPFASPGLVSLTKVYSGIPLNVTCLMPSERVIVPSVPLTPDPAVGLPLATVNAGQFCKHALLQLLVPGVSAPKT